LACVAPSAADGLGDAAVAVPGPGPCTGVLGVLVLHPAAPRAATTEMAARISVRLRMPLRRRHPALGCAGQVNAGMTSVANSSAERSVSANVMSPKANSREK